MTYLSIGRHTKNLTGQIFGRLTVLGIVAYKARAAMWQCRCECGAIKTINGSNMLRGNSKSCGCLKKDSLTVHNKSYSPIYNVWRGMVQRCTNPKAKSWKNYGGRGIRVSDSWLDFPTFYADMGDQPQGMQIDRKDNEGHYCKENCQWATQAENKRNTRRIVFIVYKGITAGVSEHARLHGIAPGTVHSRLKKGWSIEHAITTPVKTKRDSA